MREMTGGLTLLLLCVTAVAGFSFTAVTPLGGQGVAGGVHTHRCSSARTQQLGQGLWTGQQQRRSAVGLWAEKGSRSGKSGKKRRRRRVDEGGKAQEKRVVVSGEQIENIKGSISSLSFDPTVTELFDEDWGGMQAPQGMPKPKTLPQQARIKLPGSLGERGGGEEVSPDDTRYESSLTPISGSAAAAKLEDTRSAAEKFEEGSILKGIKTGTWFAILSLVGWEIYIHSPLFTTGD